MPVNFTPTTVSNPEGVQGQYPFRMPIGHEGMIADQRDYVSASYRNQSGGVIPFGVLVQTDNDPTSNDPFAVQPAINGSLIQGLALDSFTFEGASGGIYDARPGTYPGSAIAADGRMGYPDKQTLNVMSRGIAIVYSCEAIALGDAVRFFGVAHDGTLAGAFVGRFGKTAVDNKTFNITAGARWMSETATPGLVLLEINLPNMTFSADV
jgi:hypothetical protein